MKDFVKFFDKISTLTNEAINDLNAVISEKTFAKGNFLLQQGNTCRQLFYLQSGLFKLLFYKDDKEFIMRFFQENSFFTGLDSYFTQTDSSYTIQALEPTIVNFITYADMEHLCKKHHCIETAFRKFVSTASVNMMNRISEMLEENGTERYNNFVRTNNSLMPRISLGDLAAYLGITQVSLSRIRAQPWLFNICKKIFPEMAAPLP